MSDPACSATIITQADVIALLDKLRGAIERAGDIEIIITGENIERHSLLMGALKDVARELREIGQACG